MGDVWLIAGSFVGIGIIYAIVLTCLALKTETTERPDLKKKES
jgi:hypothetical protein